MPELKRMSAIGLMGGNNGSAPNKKSKMKNGMAQTPAQVDKGCKNNDLCPSSRKYAKKNMPKNRKK